MTFDAGFAHKRNGPLSGTLHRTSAQAAVIQRDVVGLHCDWPPMHRPRERSGQSLGRGVNAGVCEGNRVRAIACSLQTLNRHGPTSRGRKNLYWLMKWLNRMRRSSVH